MAKSEGGDFLDHLRACADPEDFPRLVAACSGRVVRIPRMRTGPNSWLSRTIGVEKANELVRKLNIISRYDSNIEVPFYGRGLHGMAVQATRRRAIEGFIVGKSTALIAVECGVTRRAIQMMRVRLRRDGLLPEPSRSTTLLAGYFGNAPAHVPPVTPTLDPLPPADDVDPGPPSEQASLLEGYKLIEDRELTGLGREERILDLIEKTCGSENTRSIVEFSRDRLIWFGPQALRKVRHPLRRVLGERPGKLLALNIVIVFGHEPACLKMR